MENLKVQELSVEDQMEIDGGYWPLIIAAGLAVGYIARRNSCECK